MRWAQKRSEVEEEGRAERTSRESAPKTLALANKAWCRRKSKPRMGMETGASWKDQEKWREPKRRGMKLTTKQGSRESQVVSSLLWGELTESEQPGEKQRNLQLEKGHELPVGQLVSRNPGTWRTATLSLVAVVVMIPAEV